MSIDVKMKSEPQFDSDFRKTNPGLHELYMRWAKELLDMIDRQMTELFDRGMVSAGFVGSSLMVHYIILIDTDAAYYEVDRKKLMSMPKEKRYEILHNREGWRKTNEYRMHKDGKAYEQVK